MGGLSDKMLAGGCVPLLESIHGQAFKVLSGPDAGKTFYGVFEVVQETSFNGETGAVELRAKNVVRFSPDSFPNLRPQDMLQSFGTGAGKWKASRQSESDYITVDFQLVQMVAGIDK